MKKIKFVLLICILIPLIYGCATSKAIKHEYNKNKQQDDWDTGQEAKSIGRGMKTDFYRVFVLPFKNIFTGRIFKENTKTNSTESD